MPAPTEDNAPELTDRQEAFIAFYLQTFNATEAAKKAGYSDESARQMGSENLSKPYIADAIKQRLAELSATADESVARVTRRARATMRDFYRLDEDGYPVFDLRVAFENGAIDMVKKVSPGKNGTTYELHDAAAADALLLRVHGKLKGDTAPPDDEGNVLELPANGRSANP